MTDFSKRMCGECGARSFSRKDYRGRRLMAPWRDFPDVMVTRTLLLWTCETCGETASGPGDARSSDEAIEGSIRDQAREFIERIKYHSGQTIDVIAASLGTSPSLLDRIGACQETPSYPMWKVLRDLAE
jgi:hypothetical protein